MVTKEHQTFVAQVVKHWACRLDLVAGAPQKGRSRPPRDASLRMSKVERRALRKHSERLQMSSPAYGRSWLPIYPSQHAFCLHIAPADKPLTCGCSRKQAFLVHPGRSTTLHMQSCM